MTQSDFVGRYGPAALVTGASSGIGKAFAEVLAEKSMDVVVVARRKQRLVDLAARLEQEYAVKVTVCEVDLAAADAAEQILDATAAIDIGLLVSNAGFGLKGAFERDDPKQLSEMLAVNCHTPMQLARGFVPRLRQRGRGGIVFTSSVEGLIGCPYSAVYSATKGFVNTFGEALWGELTPEGYSVLTLCPGATATEAAALQGIDMSQNPNVMSPDEVVALTLDNLDNGPTFIPSAHYRATFDHLLSMPRRDALAAMAKSMKR